MKITSLLPSIRANGFNKKKKRMKKIYFKSDRISKEQQQALSEKNCKQLLLESDKCRIIHSDELFIRELTEKINKNLSKENFSIDFLALKMNMSRRTLYRRMAAITDITLGNFIRNIRIQKAAQLLKQHEITITEIAYEVGYKNPKHFSKSFKEFYGLCPSEYQKKYFK